MGAPTVSGYLMIFGKTHLLQYFGTKCWEDK